ncbi:MAG: Maf family protein [Anaerolineae bacterium]|nr:Maf family protein [Anaerolineae bacterium]
MGKVRLASASPRRRELLSWLGLPFEVVAPDVDESPREGEEPAALVTRLSLAKASAACHPGDPEVVIACDTIVVLDGAVLGKPRDEQEAVSMLRQLRGRPHLVYSAVALISPASGRAATDLVETAVTMRNYTDEDIARYIATGDPLDKAGAYAIQHEQFRPVARLEGCYTNVVGLPLCHLTRALRRWGIEVPVEPHVVCHTRTGYLCHIYPTILDTR